MSPPLPRWLDQPLRAVLRDLQHPHPVHVRVGYSEEHDGAWLWIQELGTRGPHGVWIPPDARGTTLVARIADQLQEQFFPESRAAWGEARPGCPGHPHPASADCDENGAWWICPQDAHRIAAIGEYAPG
jgi:hypothetical protein